MEGNDQRTSFRASSREMITGKWHLSPDPLIYNKVSAHRMDLVFYTDAGSLRGAILNRITGDEIPLAGVDFDGSNLKLTIEASEAKDVPMLTMKLEHGRFEGYWVRPPGQRIGPKLTLVRARS